MTLPDATRVYPGARCGFGLRQEFVNRPVVDDRGSEGDELRPARSRQGRRSWNWSPKGSHRAPSYFVYDAILNRKDRELLDETKMPTAMTYRTSPRGDRAVALVLSTDAAPRNSPKVTCAHAINIGLEGRYAEFAGSVLPADVDIVLFTEPGQELEGKNRLARIGFDRVIGYLDRPFEVMLSHRDDVRGRIAADREGIRPTRFGAGGSADRRRPQPG